MNIPAGIFDGDTEFFFGSNDIHAFVHGQIVKWASLPARIIELVREDLQRHPEAVARLAHLPADDQLRTFVKCKFGAMGHDTPDLTACGKSNAEYWNCEGTGCDGCLLKGVLRNQLKAAHGALSLREIEVLKLIAAGYPGKIICSELDIAESTFNTHKATIFKKTGLHSNVELALWATKNNLI